MSVTLRSPEPFNTEEMMLLSVIFDTYDKIEEEERENLNIGVNDIIFRRSAQNSSNLDELQMFVGMYTRDFFCQTVKKAMASVLVFEKKDPEESQNDDQNTKTTRKTIRFLPVTLYDFPLFDTAEICLNQKIDHILLYQNNKVKFKLQNELLEFIAN